jgi:hypothetical protein
MTCWPEVPFQVLRGTDTAVPSADFNLNRQEELFHFQNAK